MSKEEKSLWSSHASKKKLTNHTNNPPITFQKVGVYVCVCGNIMRGFSTYYIDRDFCNRLQ